MPDDILGTRDLVVIVKTKSLGSWRLHSSQGRKIINKSVRNRFG